MGSRPETARPALDSRSIAYIVVVSLVGLGAAAITIAAGPVEAHLEFLVLCVLATLLGSRTVRLWSTVEMSVALPFIYAALLLYGAASATLISVLAAFSACLMRTRRLDTPRVAFNTAVIAGTTVVAAWIYLWLGGQVGLVHLGISSWALLISTLSYYALNTALVSGIIHLTQDRPLLQVWKENFIWSAPSYFTGSLIGLMLVLLLNSFGMMAFAVALPPSILIYFFYRMYTERMAMQRRQLEHVAAMNARLETKVAERTRELEESNRQLQVSNRMKSQFLANVSHELRTPLNAIIGFSELLLNDAERPLSETQSEYARDILTSGQHLLELINDILDLSKVEAGKMELNVETFHLDDIAEASLTMIRPIADRKGIELTLSMPPDLPAIQADPARIKQILHNLLSNAVKFTPEGGRVDLSVELRDHALTVSVTDTGIGIAEEDRARVFSEFLQLDGTYARKYQGTGLGLALVKRFVQMHGGSIRLESTPGKGSCFSFDLPVALLVEPAAAGSPRRGEDDPPMWEIGAPAGRTILVVEDNPLNAKLVRRVLQESGHHVVEAGTAHEAIERARESRPDLILMDIQLPDMDGLEATRALNADPRTHGIPTVALTAHAMKGDDARAKDAGCCGYIPKPIDLSRFPAIVDRFLKEATP